MVQNEADSLHEKMGKLEIALCTSFRNDILERFNARNHTLQDSKMVPSSAVMALKFLKTSVDSKREKFDQCEDAGKRLSGTAEYALVRHRL